MKRYAFFFIACALGACTPSTVDYEAPFDDGRTIASLDATEIAEVCESVAAVHRAHRSRLWQMACKTFAAFALSSEQCLEVHSECVAAEPTVEITCESNRAAPNDQPLCNGMTIGQFEAGVEGFLNVEIPESIEEICAMSSEERVLVGDLGRLGMSEEEIDGYNCAVNSTLTPIARANPEVCWELAFGRTCL